MTNSIRSSATSRQDSISVIYAALGKRSNHSRALARASSRGRQKLSRRQASSAAALVERLLRRFATRSASSIGFLVPAAILALVGPYVSAVSDRWGAGNCVE